MEKNVGLGDEPRLENHMLKIRVLEGIVRRDEFDRKPPVEVVEFVHMANTALVLTEPDFENDLVELERKQKEYDVFDLVKPPGREVAGLVEAH